MDTIDTDPAEAAWEAAVAREWEADWSDPREVIYTLADGEPVEGSR